MLDCRAARPFLALLALLAMLVALCPATPAQAAKRPPTPAELQAAQDRVNAAKGSVVSLQVRAERAAEAYNGALLRAQQASALRARARVAAQVAQRGYSIAQTAADAAQADADAATATAGRAEEASSAASADAVQSQRAFDLMAVGAYETGGQIGAFAQLMLSRDPLELAQGRVLMNQVANYQQRVIQTMRVAKVRSRAAADAAANAEAAATTAADHAASVLAAAAAAREVARAASRQATEAATAAHQAYVAATAARVHAQALVTQAEHELGRAVLSAKALQKAAAAARAAASGVATGHISSEAARIAIHWAFQEIGVPYSWGGGDENGPTRGFAQGASTVGFDCSGLTLFIYHKAGIHLDHYTGSQWNQGKRISSRSELQPGDLMFFAYDTSNPDTIHHVAIYIGNGRLIEAPYTGSVVRVASANRSDFIGAVRPWVSA